MENPLKKQLLQNQLDWIHRSFNPGVVDPYIFDILKEYAQEQGITLREPDVK